ncbi:MAG: hypothetical protein KC420_19480 [Myxococcales bacterium]|nr:hypothetical protein [Myxococcales bacterium]MCB9703672.1 hypothetical protein [Myxococcales bacterium]
MSRTPLLAALLALAACHGDDGVTSATEGTSSTGTTGEPAPDFSIPDINPASPRYGDQVSPRDYLERASGWVFLHST